MDDGARGSDLPDPLPLGGSGRHAVPDPPGPFVPTTAVTRGAGSSAVVAAAARIWRGGDSGDVWAGGMRQASIGQVAGDARVVVGPCFCFLFFSSICASIGSYFQTRSPSHGSHTRGYRSLSTVATGPSQP